MILSNHLQPAPRHAEQMEAVRAGVRRPEMVRSLTCYRGDEQISMWVVSCRRFIILFCFLLETIAHEFRNLQSYFNRLVFPVLDPTY